MHEDLSQPTKDEVLFQLRRRYVSAGREHQRKLITQAVELLGYHRKGALRALRARPKPPAAPALSLGRPREDPPATLLPMLKPIGFAAFQSCGSGLVARLPEWLPAYKADHRRLDVGSNGCSW